MKINKLLIASVLAVALLGCGKREPRHLVIMPDVSGSIDRESLDQAFKAIDELAAHLQRGDRLTIIPILGDAEADASGRILRFEVPANRQAYDTDLRNFREKLNVSLEQVRSHAITHPGAKTDILGTISLAAQEFRAELEAKQILIILSDFIQDDAGFNFRTDQRLTNHATTKTLAIQVTKANDCNFKDVQVYLGLIRSNEYAKMSKTRRQSIQEFWTYYFMNSGGRAKFVTDGSGGLRIFQQSISYVHEGALVPRAEN